MVALKYVNKLWSELDLHLTLEHSLLYPDLKRLNDSRINDLLKEYNSDFEAVWEFAEDACGSWMDVNLLEKTPQLFIDEFQNIFSILKNRIEIENKEFFPALEKALAER